MVLRVLVSSLPSISGLGETYGTPKSSAKSVGWLARFHGKTWQFIDCLDMATPSPEGMVITKMMKHVGLDDDMLLVW